MLFVWKFFSNPGSDCLISLGTGGHYLPGRGFFYLLPASDPVGTLGLQDCVGVDEASPHSLKGQFYLKEGPQTAV